MIGAICVLVPFDYVFIVVDVAAAVIVVVLLHILKVPSRTSQSVLTVCVQVVYLYINLSIFLFNKIWAQNKLFLYNILKIVV